MVHKAKQWIEKNGFDFIVTGEVIGQRPKSQRKDTMPVVAQESGAEDLLLRPLCARNLPATRPEREGWVDRDRLYGFEGRSRKPQMALARQLGFEDYAQPAGGCCFLTDTQYSRKLADLWRARGNRHYELDDIMLLKVGRHLRPRSHFKMIVGREEGENRFLEGYRKQFTYLYSTSHNGPLVLIDGETSNEDLELAAQITARFSQGRCAEKVDIEIHPRHGDCFTKQVKPMAGEQIPQDWYL
jgi:tRNA U34 2-thiouridine synthase MnmA/TrmU